MADNLQNRRPQDASKINVHEDWEAQYWSKKFGCTKAELEKAVQDIGTSTKAVEAKLKK